MICTDVAARGIDVNGLPYGKRNVRRNGVMDSAPDCCTICGVVAGFASITILRSPKSLVGPGYTIDT